MSSSRISTRPSRHQPFATGAATSTSTTTTTEPFSAGVGTMTQRNAASTTASHHHRVPHRVTVRKTAYQVNKLQEMWAQTHTPTKEQREQIAEEIGLETRIVSTWFRDERSKETRARAEKQRMERGTVGPVRNTRTSTAASLRKEGHEQLGAGSDEEDMEEAPTLDRHTSPQQAMAIQVQAQRASPRTRYAPYPVSHSHSIDLSSPSSNLFVAPKKLPSQRHFDPLIRASVPIDFHPNPSDHDHHDPLANMDTDADDSYGYPSPNGTYASASRQPRSSSLHQRLTPTVRTTAYPRQSLPPPPPAPSMSSSSSETSEDDEVEELEEEEEEDDELLVLRPREFSPRTPALIPSTIPSPRVFQPSTSPNSLPPISTLGPSSPSNFVSSSPLPKPPVVPSPYNLPITLPTQSGGTYTFKPLPVIVGPLPRRDSTWRFNYYDKVSSVRQTLGNKLHHDDGSAIAYPHHHRHHHQAGSGAVGDESDGDSASEDGIAASPAVGASRTTTGASTTTTSGTGGILSGLGGLFGGVGKKQLFAST